MKANKELPVGDKVFDWFRCLSILLLPLALLGGLVIMLGLTPDEMLATNESEEIVSSTAEAVNTTNSNVEGLRISGFYIGMTVEDFQDVINRYPDAHPSQASCGKNKNFNISGMLHDNACHLYAKAVLGAAVDVVALFYEGEAKLIEISGSVDFGRKLIGAVTAKYGEPSRYNEGIFVDTPVWEDSNSILYDVLGGSVRMQSTDFNSIVEQRNALKNKANADDI